MAKQPPQMTEIKLKSGMVIHFLSNKQLWVSIEPAAWSSAGYVQDGYWNYTPVLSTYSKNGFAISKAIVTFASRFGIKWLRLEMVTIKKSKRGWVQEVRYGYVSQHRFKKLLKFRDTVQGSQGKMLVLLEKDLLIKGA